MKVAVISGKGGSGKSSVSAALIALSRRVVAVDCDVDASNLPLLFPHHSLSCEMFTSGIEVRVDHDLCVGCGICVDHCAFSALELGEDGIAKTRDFMCEGCGLCVRLCPQKALNLIPVGGSSIITSSFSQGIMVNGELCPGDDNSGKMIARLREIADEEMSHRNMDIQILDGPPGIGCPVLSTVTGMDVVVMVAEPTLSGISDMMRAYRVARSFCSRVLVIINKSDINEVNREAIERFCQENGLPLIARLPFDRRVVEAQLQRQTMVTYASESVWTKEIIQAYQFIFRISVEP